MKLFLVAHRALIGVLVLAGAVLVSWFWQPEIALPVSAYGEPVRGESTQMNLELVGDVSETDRAPLANVEPRADNSEAIVEISEPIEEVASKVWDLIAELERIAVQEEEFHHLALPVMRELTRACAAEELSAEIMETVVYAADQNVLVRGAALVSVATLLPQPAFELGLLGWFGSERTPLELLRAAAIAAALRGEDSRCGLPLDLAFLCELQRKGDAGELRMPRIFPLRLERTVNQAHGDVLRRWLLTAEARATALYTAEAGPDMPQVAELLVTAELLYSVWGHAALNDFEIEAVVLEDAFKPEEKRGDDGLFYLRASNFLVHSLAPCNDRFFELVTKMAEMEDGILDSFATAMEGHLSNGLSVSLLAKIESVRYSIEGVDYIVLCEHLMTVGDGLASITDPEELERAFAYVEDIVQDEMVHQSARSTAIMTLEEHAPWEVLVRAVADVIQPGISSSLYAITVTSLVQEAGSDLARRSTARDLLVKARERVTEQRMSESLSAYIEQLSH